MTTNLKPELAGSCCSAPFFTAVGGELLFLKKKAPTAPVTVAVKLLLRLLPSAQNKLA